MTGRSELWDRNSRFPSFMTVQWTSDIGGRRVCRGLFCPVQLISPKIIPPVGEGWGATQQRFILYGKLTAVKRSSMRNALVSGPGRGTFPREILIETIAETCVKQSIVEQSSEIR